MNLAYIKVDNHYRFINKLKHLYEHAFPVDERPPFSILLAMENNNLYGVEDNDEFVGLFSTVIRDDLLYIFFLAIKKKYRHKGYGSQTLKDIIDNNSDKRIFLMAEDPDIPSSNKEERKQRISFYKNRGLYLTDTKITEYGVQYVLLTNGSEVSKDDFLRIMEHITGEYYPIYLKNVH